MHRSGRSAIEALEDRALLTSYIVDTIEDGSVAGDGAISLREAITAANLDAAFLDAPAGSGPDTITFHPSLNGMTISLNGSALTVSDSLSISDSNLVPISIDGGDSSGVFALSSGVLAVSDISITGGNALQGGGIFVAGGSRLDLDSVTISGNTATGNAATDGGGGIYSDGGTLNITDSTITSNFATGTSGSGGGIFSTAGTVTVNTSTISLNAANRAGGGIELIEGTAQLTSVNIINNDVDLGTANPGNGGGVHITGAANFTMDGGSVFGNLAGREGGGLWNGSGIMTIQNGTLISGNEAGGDASDDGGGGIFNNGGTLIIDGSAAPVQITNNVAFGLLGSGGGIFNAVGGTATISDALITGNEAERAGGGIEDASAVAGIVGLSLVNVTLDGNTAFGTDLTAPGNGGGLHVSGAGDVNISGGTVNDNIAALEGGGLWNGSGVMTIINGTVINNNTAGGNGGGVLNDGGTVMLADTAITGNSSGGDEAGEGGGGVYNDGTLNVSGGTIGNNTAIVMLGNGGGILNSATGTASVSGTTISGNSAGRAGGGIESAGTLSLSTVDLTDNFAGVNGGGLHVSGPAATNIAGGTVTGNFAAAEGGGLWNGSGIMAITGGTIIEANGAAGGGADQGGGGVFNAGGTINITGGAIRNNIASGGASFSLSGDQESPVVTTTATGTADFQYNAVTDTFDLRLRVTGLELTDLTAAPEITGAHIHVADAGTNGPVIVNLLDAGSFEVVDGGLVLILRDIAFPPQHAAALFANGAYINVHSTANTGGEIRGQITFPATMGSGGGILNDQGTVSVTNTVITGNIASRAGGGIESNVGELSLTDVSLDGNTAGVTGAATPGNGGGLHITGAGNATITGGTVNGNVASAEGGGLWNGTGTLTVQPGTGGGSGTSIAQNSAFGLLADQGGGGIFNAGGTVNVDSASIFENTTLGSTTISLTGDQQDPAVTTAAIGVADFLFNPSTNTYRLNLFISGLEKTDTTAAPEITAAHIHLAAAGASGPVIVNLFSELAVQEEGGVRLIQELAAFPPEYVEALLTGGTYINVHSSANAGGEVRGQLTFAPGASSGGGIFNDGGTVTVSNGFISGNTTARAGGGIETNGGMVTVANTTLSANIAGIAGAAAPGNGGGLHTSAAGTVSFIGGSVLNNQAANEGGGLWNSGTGTLTVNGTLITQNTAVDGGGVYVQAGSGTPGSTTISSAQIITNTATGAAATQGGGGILNEGILSVADTRFVSNTATGTSGSGGGILNVGGMLNVSGSTFQSNSANRAGGGIEDNAGVSTIIASTFIFNSAGSTPGNGGGVHLTGSSDVTLHNATFSENTAVNEGGALWNSATGKLTVRNSTIVLNTVDKAAAGGGVFTVAGGDTVLVNTIVAGNSANTASTPDDDDVSGALLNANSTNNVIGNAATSGGLTDATAGNIVGTAGVGTLAVGSIINATRTGGGSIPSYHELVFGSPAVNAGTDLSGVGITTDQAGSARPQGVAYDIGAIEADGNLASGLMVTIADAAIIAENQAAVFTVTISGNPTTPVTVVVTTMDGTAIAGSDYVSVTQTLTFNPDGPLTQNVTVPTVDDAISEDREIFQAVLSNSSGALIGDGVATGTIDDNDSAGRPVLDSIARYPGVRPTITWQAVDGASGYEVWVGRIFPDQSRILLSESSVTGTAYTPGGDLDPAFYRVWVRSVTSGNVAGAWSTPIVFEVQPTVVSPTTPGFNRRPTFVWNPIPNTSGYELFIRTSNGDIILTNLQGTTYTPSADLPNGPIRWWIRSSDAISNRGYSAAADFSFETTVLSPAGTTSNTTPTITWRQVDNALRYVVYLLNTDTSVVVRSDNVQTTSFTPTQALPTGNYRVWVKAIGLSNNFNDGRWSQSLNFTIAANDAEEAVTAPDDDLMMLASLNLDVSAALTIDRDRVAPKVNLVDEANDVFESAPMPLWTDGQLAALMAEAKSSSSELSSGEAGSGEAGSGGAGSGGAGSDEVLANGIDIWMANAEAVAELLLS